MPEPKLPPYKKFDPKDSNPCAGCSNCCEYMSLEIDAPTSIKDFDQIMWYLIHKDVWVYVEKGDEGNEWYVQFNTPCEKLDSFRCSYYPHRPQVCRDHAVETCERYGDGSPFLYQFKDELDLFEYLEEKRPKTFERLKKKINIPNSWKKEKLKRGA